MTTAKPLVRDLKGIEVPIAGNWKLDPGHAEVGFWGRHFMITKVRGRFTGVEATVGIADRPEDSMVEAVIEMGTVDSGDQTRDDHLRSSDHFDIEKWPTATYRSTRITWEGSSGTMTGDLTIKGITRPVVLDVTFAGAVRDPWGSDRAVFDAEGIINRGDWGLTWNQPLETGGLVVSKEIHLEFHLDLIKEE